MKIGRRWRILGVAAILAVVTGLIQPGVASGSGIVVGPGTFPDKGVLLLNNDAGGTFFEYDPPAGSNVTQALTFSGTCGLTSDDSLAKLTAAGSNAQPKVGNFDFGYGVCGKGQEGQGQPAGRVDADMGQSLTVKLAGTTIGSFEIDTAELDIEAKFGGIVQAALYLDGALQATVTLDTSSSPDSNPDSGDNDNTRWVIGNKDPSNASIVFTQAPLFDEIKLTAATGAFSLDAGEDGTVSAFYGTQNTTRDSLFHLIDVSGVLECGDSSGDTQTNQGDPVANVTREQGACNTGVPYLLQTSPDQVQFIKPEVAGTFFTMVITWAPETAQNPPPATQVDYGTSDPADPDRGPHSAVWCGSDANGSPTIPATELYCLTKQVWKLVANGQIQGTETYFGKLDPTWVR